VCSPLWVTITTHVPVGRSGSHYQTGRRRREPISSMSRLRPAMSAPRRPTNATSPPSAAIQGGDVRPGSAPVHGDVRGRVAAAGERPASHGRPAVSHQVANDHHACHTRHHLIARTRFYYRSGQRAGAASGRARTSGQDARVTRSRREDCHLTVIRKHSLAMPPEAGRVRPRPVRPPPTRPPAPGSAGRASSRNSRPAGVAGTTPSPVSSLTATTWHGLAATRRISSGQPGG